MRPCAWGVVLLLLAANSLFVVVSKGYSQSNELVMIGLGLGQVGGLAAIVFAASWPHWGWRLAGCFAGAAATGLFLVGAGGPSTSTVQLFFFMSIFLLHAVMTLLLIALWILFAKWSGVTNSSASTVPRFRVLHLLVASVAVAVTSAVVKVALPEWSDAELLRIFAIIFESALLALAAFALFGKPPFRWIYVATLVGFGVLLAIVTVEVEDYFDKWSQVWFINAIEIAILLLVLVVPRLDRYAMKISWTRRDDVS